MQSTKLKTYMETGRVIFLPVGSVHPNPRQPRRYFDPQALEELADSIGQYGILQPLTVRRVAGNYELVAGERRLRAAKMAGLTEVPCLLVAMDETESSLAAMIENLQRRDLQFLEEAQGLARLMQLYGMSQDQVARRVGKSQSAVANKLRLLKHSGRVLDAIQEAGLTERHARALLKLESDQDKLRIIQLIQQRSMTVSQTERYIDSILSRGKPAPAPKKPDIRGFISTLTEDLARFQSAGIAAVSHRQETEQEIILTITIPK